MGKKKEAIYTFRAGKVLLVLAFLAFSGAWFTQLKATRLLGLDVWQLLVDAIALSLVGICVFLDGLWEMRNSYD